MASFIMRIRVFSMAAFFSLGCRASVVPEPAAEHDRVVLMQRYIVSATRMGKSPWRYGSIPGFEVLSRTSGEKTDWQLDALRRGLWIRNKVAPADWFPKSPLPCIVIIDDADLSASAAGRLGSQPIHFRSPSDALAWGELSTNTHLSSEPMLSYDEDGSAVDVNLHGADAQIEACSSLDLERLFYCIPPLPIWLTVGLMGQESGILRESFAVLNPIDRNGPGGFPPPTGRQVAAGPGTLWVSLDRTRQLLKQLRKDKTMKIAIPPLRELFVEAPPSGDGLALWRSEAGLFIRWGLLGPARQDPVLLRDFLELVRRARREPVTERMFTECFGFGYAAMEEKLESFLKTVLAQPTGIYPELPASFPEPTMKAATPDQIGRILGDWLRMQGDSLRDKEPALSGEFLGAAGRMLLRAYRADNGLPPDVDPSPEGERSAGPAQVAAKGPAVVMKPFVVTAAQIHDPGLLAVYGLYEHDSGDEGKAREFLEAAAAAGVARPRAYLVLAKLRYADAVAQPLGSEGKLSAQQAASILEPLQTALGRLPVAESYRLFVDTWSRCEAKPSERDVEIVLAGVAQFPRDLNLAYRSAVVCAQSGHAVQAAELIDRSLGFAVQTGYGDSFERLRSALAGPPLPGTK